MLDEGLENSPILPGRSCGTCTLCCKVLEITEIGKPRGTWCPNCNVGKSCKIYDHRPDECRTFYCGYLIAPFVTAEWWPAKSKIVLVSELGGKRLAAHVDPGRPRAWRDEPFYSMLKQWSVAAAENTSQVVVYIGNHAIVIFPDRDVDLGLVNADETVITIQQKTPMGLQLEALKVKNDDPRIAGNPSGAGQWRG